MAWNYDSDEDESNIPTDRDMACFSRHETKCFEVLIVPISNLCT